MEAHRSERTAIATELSLPRRVLGLPSTFFEWPPSRKPTDIAAHRSLGDLQATLLRKSLAMLPESEIGVGLQLRRQPLPPRLAFHRWSARDLVDVDVPCVASPLEPALEGRAGDSEEVLDLLSWDATVDGGEHFQSEVLRICVHGHHFHAGPLLTQAAVRSWCLLPYHATPRHAFITGAQRVRARTRTVPRSGPKACPWPVGRRPVGLHVPPASGRSSGP